MSFNAVEVFRLAEQIERNGVKFYRRAAELRTSEKEKNLFMDLADMEQEHESFFASVRANLESDQYSDYAPDFDPSSYLNAIADGYVFDAGVEIDEILTGSESVADILNMAIAREKDSIVFYVGLKELVPQNLGRDNIETIIQEEMNHISGLTAILAELNS
ncbi:MAG: rubrerythrin [Candidatus Wallbacteria bacterium HGW-Wallbacteria-1]|jgi:rubrerythrin|uniref:Rubrerythrin n=1 Tax=Candidatus Wallbacteria bacterium HGW-Wallbacteria-1 TaxID=2013854 RepID=A0A2N1PNQ3_9BACT|nr:MAG: rubrerythrin [Candidatus Wallbacteria bacterium HGW-Wallbacteria-1]